MNAMLFVILWLGVSVLGTLAGIRLCPGVHRTLIGLAVSVGSAIILYGLIIAVLAFSRF